MTPEQWQRVQHVFDSVADLESDARRTKLDDLTRGDPNLRAEVESLLTHDTVERMPALATSTLEPAYKLGSVIGEPSENAAGRYRLLFPLAINHHSEVWCGEQLINAPVGDDRVAIKFLRNETMDARRFDRFVNEAEHLKRFRHPNIASFVESGCTENEIPYIVTRFVSGKPITEFADQDQLSIEQRADLMIRVCDAVGYAHRFLVVHRDLKPSNILVTADGQPIVLDFGISKELSQDHETNITTTHERPMTPAYASPEQVRGESITTLTDVHGLGLLLYEIMTGHHPFSAAAHENRLPLFDRISQSLPKKPSDIIMQTARRLGAPDESGSNSRVLAGLRGGSPNQIRRQLKRGLDQVIQQAIQKSPDDRYASVADIRNDLVNVRENRPVSVPGTRTNFQTRVRQRPWFWLIAAAGLGGLLTAVATGLWWNNQYRSANVAMEESTRELQQLRQEHELSTGNYDALLNSVESALANHDDSLPTSVKPLSLAVRAALARRAIENGKPNTARSLVGEPTQYADQPLHVRTNAAATFQQLGLPTNGLTVLGQYGDSQDEPDSPFDEIALDFECILIQLLNDAGRHDEAYQLEESVVRDAPSHENDPRFYLVSAAARHEIGWEKGFDNRIEWLDDRASEIGLSEQHREQLSLLRARVAFDLEKPTAETLLQQIVDTVDGRSFHSFTTRSEALLLISELDRKAGDDAKAESRLREILDLAERQRLEDHNLVIKAMLALSEILDESDQEPGENDWLIRCWQVAKDANELGTSTAFVVADEIMRKRDVDFDYHVLNAIAPYRTTFRQLPYLNRAILQNEFHASVQRSDFARAVTSSEELTKIEPELWGNNSLENVWALASYGHALELSGHSDKASTALAPVQRIIGEFKTNEQRPVSVVFLEPIAQAEQSDFAKPFYRWIELYMQQHRNSREIQLEMAHYVAASIAKDFPKDHAILQQAIKAQKP